MTCPETWILLIRSPVPQRSITYGGSMYFPLMKTAPAENGLPRVTPSALPLAIGSSLKALAVSAATTDVSAAKPLNLLNLLNLLKPFLKDPTLP